jgi:hypothetical protein
MKTNAEFKIRLCGQFKNLLAVWTGVLLLCLAALALASTVPARAGTPPAAIPISDIGAKATADYPGDALGITVTSDGARLRCGFQKLEARATPEGLWLESTAPGTAGKLRLTASAIGRAGLSTLNPVKGRGPHGVLHPQLSTLLPATGTVSVEDKLVRFTRPGLTEEYSVSADGVRQDFVIAAPPAGAGDLRVELALSGARAEAAACGARLTLEGSGRALAYSRLRVEDATGRELTARLEVLSANRLAVSVADANATYPVRIDPTFSDANWVSLNTGLPGADGRVSAIAVDDSGNVYVSGEFTFIGTVPAIGIAKWDGSAWSALGQGVSTGTFRGYVYALAASGTNLYAGGQFTTAGGVAANYIAKWDGSTWSALGQGMSAGLYRYGYVLTLAVSGTNLYAGGDFTNAGGMSANYIAKWDGSSWSALGSGMSGSSPYVTCVCALAVSGTNLYAVGDFTNAGGVAANRIAKWDGSTWSALGSGIGPNSYINALAVSGTNLYAGGQFTTAGGVPANCIAKWDGSAWSALGWGIGGFSPSVSALGVSGTNLYVGGAFTRAGEVATANIAKWDGSAWSALGSGIDNSNLNVLTLAVSGTNLYAGGDFTTVSGVAANHIAKWDGSAWSALGPSSGMNNNVTALAVSRTNLYAGGVFTTAGGVPVNYIAKWDGSVWSALGSGMNDQVAALAVSGTNLYAGGRFTMAGGVAANYIAKWDGSVWSPLGSGMDVPSFPSPDFPYVHVLAVVGTNLYAGGGFTTAGGVPANYIAKWDGSAWSALGSGMGGSYPSVNALAVSGTNLYVGGGFTNAGGVPANHIAKWDGSVWSALGSGTNGGALAVIGTNLYAGGVGVFKWDGSAWSALGPGMNGQVSALAVSGTDLYAAGSFTTAGGVPANNIAKWDGNAWSALGSGMNAGVSALAVDGWGHLFVGGSFTVAGTNVSPFIAVANLSGVPTILVPLPSQTAEDGGVINLAARIIGYPPTSFQWFFNGNAIEDCTNRVLCLSSVQATNMGTYSVIVSNIFGAVTSSPAMLNVIPMVERRPVPAVNLTAQPGSSLGLDYCDALGSTANWETMATMTLSNTSQFYFDVSVPLPPQRFYRAWQPGMPSVAPSLCLPGMVPAITLSGNIGDQLRLDCINRIGPTDAWVTLDTVTLTNTSQLYFDVSSISQPRRLYRIVPVP